MSKIASIDSLEGRLDSGNVRESSLCNVEEVSNFRSCTTLSVHANDLDGLSSQLGHCNGSGQAQPESLEMVSRSRKKEFDLAADVRWIHLKVWRQYSQFRYSKRSWRPGVSNNESRIFFDGSSLCNLSRVGSMLRSNEHTKNARKGESCSFALIITMVKLLSFVIANRSRFHILLSIVSALHWSLCEWFTPKVLPVCVEHCVRPPRGLKVKT